MALRDNEQYYYFKMRLGKPYEIKVTAVHVNTILNRIYQEMTTEQREFYLEHPDATVMEVWDCELVPPYVPPAPDVAEYARAKAQDFKDACIGSVSVTAMEYAMANAVLAGTSINYPGSRHYTLSEAKAVMKRFMDESAAAMDLYDTLSVSILAASSRKEADAAFDAAMAASFHP